MAELIVAGPALITAIQFSDRIVGLCKHYIETVRDYPSDLRTILVEISFLKTTLENLKILVPCSGNTSDQSQGSHKLKGPIEECLRLVQELEKLFPSDIQQSSENTSKRPKMKVTFAQLAWPLKESKARKILDSIRPLKETFILELTSQSRQDIREIKSQTSKTQDVVTESQRHEIYKWLQHTDPSTLYYKLRQDYEPETGNWVPRSMEWRDWIDLRYQCLWIHGIPGAGKSVLISHLIGTIQEYCETPEADGCVSVYYFCFYGHNQDEGKPFLRWLINQLCRKEKSVPSSVLSMYNYGGEPSLADLLKALEEILREFKTVYVVIDALDESLPRHDTLEVVQQIVKDTRFRNVQLLAASRREVDIRNLMETISIPLSMDNDYVGEDIRRYVHSSVHSNTKFRRFSTDLLSEIEDAVSEGAKGMFRWAVCQLDILQRLKCDSAVIRKALKDLPETLQQTYDRIFLNLPKEQRYVLRCLLDWIRFYSGLYEHGIPCQLLVQVAERCTSTSNAFRLGYFYDEEIIRELCGCLIKISPTEVLDDPPFTILTVGFAHYTVREYIDAGGHSRDSAGKLATPEGASLQQPLRMVFEEALLVNVNTAALQNMASPDPNSLREAMFADFNISCTVTALYALQGCASEIAKEKHLFRLACGLLDPLSPSFGPLCLLASRIEDRFRYFSKNGMHGQIWKVMFIKGGSPSAMQLIYLLTWVGCDDSTFPLIKRFVEMSGIWQLTQERLRFQTNALLDISFDLCYVMDGSIIEAAAQGLFTDMGAFAQLLDLVGDLPDPSRVLYLYIGGARYGLDNKVLTKLLERGADPNYRKQRVTSLQIAVSRVTFFGVEALLTAGADPNGAGNAAESPWEEKSLMNQFNQFFGASPLYMCRNHVDLESDMGIWDGGGFDDIEAILVEYGAKSFLRPESALILRT